MGRGGQSAVLLALVAVSAGIFGGCGGDEGQGSQVSHFDSQQAWALVKRQVDAGPRPAGSPPLRRLATELRSLLPNGHFEAVPGQPGLRNVVGTLPGRRPGIVVGAHYDTLVKPRGFVGANNGAAGTAVVIETAQALSALPRPARAREVRFVLFDGEEPAAGLPETAAEFYREGLRGSKAYVAANRNRTEAMILLDYVGNRGLRLPREESSDPKLWRRVLGAAATVGASGYFSSETVPGILDDHSPFRRGGIPAVDLIDWKYPGHSLGDGLDKISRRSLDGVGETIVALVDELRGE
jgi:glutaminyl-peptide cyclotransferase